MSLSSFLSVTVQLGGGHGMIAAAGQGGPPELIINFAEPLPGSSKLV